MYILKLQCPICLKEQNVYPYTRVYTCSNKVNEIKKHYFIWTVDDSIVNLVYLSLYLDDFLAIEIDVQNVRVAGASRLIKRYVCFLYKNLSLQSEFILDDKLYNLFKNCILENTTESKEKIKKLLLLR